MTKPVQDMSRDELLEIVEDLRKNPPVQRVHIDSYRVGPKDPVLRGLWIGALIVAGLIFLWILSL